MRHVSQRLKVQFCANLLKTKTVLTWMSCSLLSLHSGYKTPCSHSLLQCSGNVSYYYYSVHQFPLRFVQLSLNFSSNGVTSVFVTEPSSVINFINLLFRCKCKSAPTAWPPFIGSVKALRSSVNVEPWCRPCLQRSPRWTGFEWWIIYCGCVS